MADFSKPDFFIIEFRPSGRGKAQCEPDPAFPDGVNLDATGGEQPACLVKLPYPAPECGMWMVNCDLCKVTVAITAAGRPDDPKSVRILCQKETNHVRAD